MAQLGNVMGVIGAVVALTISLYFVDPVQTANDSFYRLNTAHCRSDGGTTTRNLIVTAVGTTGTSVASSTTGIPTVGAVIPVVKAATGSACTLSGQTLSAAPGSSKSRTVTGTTEDDVSVTFTAAGTAKTYSSPSGWSWKVTPSFLGAFGTIVLLVISLVPLMLSVGFIGMAFRVVKQGTQSGMSGSGVITGGVMRDVGLMLIAVVAVFVAAPFMGAVESAAGVTTAGNLDSADQFSVITKLAYSILPLGYAVGIIEVTTRGGFGTSAIGGAYRVGRRAYAISRGM